jgi:hypothetical protein
MYCQLYIPEWIYDSIYLLLLHYNSSPPETDNIIIDWLFAEIEELLNNDIENIYVPTSKGQRSISEISVGEYFNTVTIHTFPEGIKYVIPFNRICCEKTDRFLPLLCSF